MLGALTFFIIRYHIELVSLSDELFSYIPAETEVGIANPAFSETHPPQQILPVNSPQTTEESDYRNTIENGVPASEQPLVQEDPSEVLSDNSHQALPDGFVYLSEALPEARFDVRYATSHNFTGKVVEGYLSDRISATAKAAEGLQRASAALKEKGYGLLIYDAYRPKRAVDSFIKWGNSSEDNLTKAEFYPDIHKKDLFKLGYLARRSAHSRGSAIDLTLFSLRTNEPLDMGSPFDFLGSVSNHGTKLITEDQTKNRDILKEALKAAGFKELRTEWWHYQLIQEPFPDTYFDFVID